eukprot:9485613-Pyramimonas_sp.AAC.1
MNVKSAFRPSPSLPRAPARHSASQLLRDSASRRQLILSIGQPRAVMCTLVWLFRSFASPAQVGICPRDQVGDVLRRGG